MSANESLPRPIESAWSPLWQRLPACNLLLAAAAKLLLPAESTVLPWWGQLAIVNLEVGIGLLLIARPYSSGAKTAAVALFASFLGFSLCSFHHGSDSCECFGQIKFDPLLAIGLAFFFLLVLELQRQPGIHPSPLLLRCLPFVVSLVASFGLAESLQPAPVNHPRDWVDAEFPLLHHVADDERGPLKRGKWMLILHKPGCPACHELLNRICPAAFPSAAGRSLALQELPSGNQVPHRDCFRRTRRRVSPIQN